MPLWPRFLGTLIFALAGLALFLLLLNRWLMFARDGRPKNIYTGLVFAALVGSAGVVGFAAGLSPWILVPALVLCAVAAGEGRRALIRRRYRGSAPVSTENVNVGLRRPLTTTDLAVLRYEIAIPGWQGPDLTIAHLSDLHVHESLPGSYYRSVIARVNDAEPDLVFITGDFVTNASNAEMLPEILGGVRSSLGVYAILGNHDYWADGPRVAGAVREAGITLLHNGCQRLSAGGKQHIVLCGCEDPWNATRWQAPETRDGDMVLVLAHTADNVYRLSRAGVAAVFAGHYHGGQVRLPLLGPLIVPSVYGRRFDRGHFVVHGTHLFVSAGIGSGHPPLRIYCQPDIVFVRIKGGRGEEMRLGR
jgi:predicted MPP superfamily phosphohydrolase